MTRDEVVIVKRMHKGAFCSGKRTLLERFPGHVVRRRNQFRAEGSHSFHLRRGRGLDDHNRAWHACLSRCISDALPGIPGTDCPDATFALGFREHRHGVGCAAQLVSIDRLEVLQFEADVGITRSQFKMEKRCAHDCLCDSFARFLYFRELD